MSQLIVLADAELDAVSGGFLNGGTGGNGGKGGTAAVGGAVQYAHFGGETVNFSTHGGTANANGGNGGAGGAVNISLRFGGR